MSEQAFERYELPAGWTWCRIDDVISSITDGPFGSNLKSSDYVDAGARVIRLGNIGLGRFVDDNKSFVSIEKFEGLRKHEAVEGDIVIAALAEPVGRACVVPPGLGLALVKADCVRARISSEIERDIVLRWLNSPAGLKSAALASHGIGRLRINLGEMRALDLPLPPLNEQRRIVEKLDAAFDKSRAAKARLERLPALLEKLKRSILAAAFRGDLTKDWRAANPDVEPASLLLERIRAERRRRWEEGLRAKGKAPKKATYEEPAPVDVAGLPELPEGWAWASVDELASLFQYGSSAKTDDVGEVPVLRMGNIFDGELVVGNLKFLPRTHDEFPELFLKPGDILFNRTNSPELVGKTAVYRGDPATCSFASYLIRVRVEVIEPAWVSYYVNSPAGRDWVRSVVAQQVGQANVNGTKLRALAVPVPPAGEIRAALMLVQAAFDAVRALRGRVERAAFAASRCEQAALGKAFRGELVPQNPTDEPASVLLDRIRAARADEPQRARRGRAARTADPELFAAKPAAPRATNGHGAEATEGEPVDLVVAAFQLTPRLTATSIGTTTGLDAASVKKALKALVDGGQVRVEGKARGTAYVWGG